MSDVEIRLVAPNDWETWREVRLRSLQESPDAFGSTLERELDFRQDDWARRLDGTGGPAFLACSDGVPVGMAGGFLPPDRPDELMIVAMWVDPAGRGRQVGRRLLDTVVAWAHDHGVKPFLWVADGNSAARRLYESYGFVPTGEQESLRADSPLRMHRMVLR
jgi:GNAT superfamily N-acetyltransferase